MTAWLSAAGMRRGVGALIVASLASVGGVVSGRWFAGWVLGSDSADRVWESVSGRLIPMSVSPGKRRQTRAWPFTLDAVNSVCMTRVPDDGSQRWLDIAGNAYSGEFSRRYSQGSIPVVRLRLESDGPLLRGRIEGKGLKPNFAYQVKLNGIYEYREAFEAIGSVGRWRFPGRATNYTDGDYTRALRKSRAEAYIMFDFLITDAAGNVVRDLELNHSLHVLWNASRQRGDCRSADSVPFWVDASAAEVYARPKALSTLERIWAEREHVRYERGDDVVCLPPGTYHATLALTEESFHDHGEDGGWWATAFELPVSFVITDDPEGRAQALMQR